MTDSVIGIARRSLSLLVIAAWTLAVSVIAQSGNQRVPPPLPSDSFLLVNGVLLHNLDWGGSGETLLFLTGLGDSVHRCDSLAPNFTDHFHVLGLTRRGQGLSGKPPSGYDTETLVEDLRRFLDVVGIKRVTMIAHSIGGVEMTRFAGKYPERVFKLVYLDSVTDWVRGQKLLADANIPYPPGGYLNRYHEAIDRQQSHPDLSKVTAPALAFFVQFDAAHAARPDEELCPGCTQEVATNVRRLWRLMYEKDFWNEQANLFRAKVKRGQVITLRDTNHFFFQDPKLTDEVTREIRNFLLPAK
jgi:pimeloyl-ACP methyl ester carboxylesterase